MNTETVPLKGEFMLKKKNKQRGKKAFKSWRIGSFPNHLLRGLEENPVLSQIHGSLSLNQKSHLPQAEPRMMKGPEDKLTQMSVPLSVCPSPAPARGTFQISAYLCTEQEYLPKASQDPEKQTWVHKLGRVGTRKSKTDPFSRKQRFRVDVAFIQKT